MEGGVLYISLLCLFVSFVYLFIRRSLHTINKLPPGRTGWPVIGETLEFVSTGWKGHSEKFVLDRMAKYSRDVFRTHIIGEPTAVFCGASGNKFLFSNENKLFRSWWPQSMERVLFGSFAQTSFHEEAAFMRRMLSDVLKPEALRGYIGIMDEIAQTHFTEKWENKEQVVVLPLTRDYTFRLACRLFMSIEDDHHITQLSQHFNVLLSGLISLPINFPGTPMNKAIKAAAFVRKQIFSIITQRKINLAQGKASPTQDILSRMLSISHVDHDQNGKFVSEKSIAAKIIGLIIGGYDTTSSACTFLVKYLAEFPEIYEAVHKEQMEIAKSKVPGELLNWEDLQKMKYSWNVVCEVLRLVPPSQGSFREVIVDFTYKGFSIPKGWKLHWNANSTHKNPEFFPEPEKFDPSRFEGSGPPPYSFVPFGGGPKMCPGNEFARLEILVFMHHLLKRFKWEKMLMDEQIVVALAPFPTKGLPVRIFPHQA